MTRLIALSGAPVVRLCEGRFGITRREWRLIALLAETGRITSSELASHAGLDRTRTSRAIASLVDKKLVERANRPNDGRMVDVRLSPEGQRLYAELFPLVADLNKRLVATLAPSVLEAFDLALRQLTEAAASIDKQVAHDVKADRRHGGAARGRGNRSLEDWPW